MKMVSTKNIIILAFVTIITVKDTYENDQLKYVGGMDATFNSTKAFERAYLHLNTNKTNGEDKVHLHAYCNHLFNEATTQYFVGLIEDPMTWCKNKFKETDFENGSMSKEVECQLALLDFGFIVDGPALQAFSYAFYYILENERNPGFRDIGKDYYFYMITMFLPYVKKSNAKGPADFCDHIPNPYLTSSLVPGLTVNINYAHLPINQNLLAKYASINHPEQFGNSRTIIQGESSTAAQINNDTTSRYEFDQNRPKDNTAQGSAEFYGHRISPHAHLAPSSSTSHTNFINYAQMPINQNLPAKYICLNHPEQVWSPNSMLQAEFSSPPMINFNTTSGYDFDQNRSPVQNLEQLSNNTKDFFSPSSSTHK